MKKLITILLLLSTTTLFAQNYIIPKSTRIFGNLTVDSSLFNTNPLTDFAIVNDSLDVGLAKFPFVGVMTNPYGSGYAINGIVDLALAGAEKGSIVSGFSSYPTAPLSRQNIFKIDTIRSRMSTELGDTASHLTIYVGSSGVSQGFDLESTFCNGCPNVGFESQFSGSGLYSAKVYATNYVGNTNLSVISVDTTGVQISTDDALNITKYNENGVVFPNLKADPTGENGAIYYNTTLNVFRIYENGAWRNM